MALDLEKLLHELRVKIRSDINVTLGEQEERITTKINDNIDQKFDHIKKEIELIKTTNEDQEKRIMIIEKQIRLKNLIFFGVEEGEKSYEDLEKKIIAIIYKMGIQCSKSEIEMVRRMGKKNENQVRPINITLSTFGKKISILKNKKTLETSKIYIKEDFPPKILEARKALQEQLQKERSEGKEAYLRYDRIVIREPKQNNLENLNSNTKKRELEVTPPPQQTKNSSVNVGQVKYQIAKKNKVQTQGERVQSSISNFVQTSKGPQKDYNDSTDKTKQ